MISISSQQFDQAPSDAKRAANDGPVFITDGGHPVHVLMTYGLYQHLIGRRQKIADLLAMPPGSADAQQQLTRSRGLATVPPLS